MKRKPWAIVILAALHFLAPFGNLVLNAYRGGRDLSSQWYFWTHGVPKPLFLTYILIPPIAGILIYICKRWSYWGYLLCLALIFISNVYAYWTNMTPATLLFLVGVIVADLLVVAYFVVPSVKKVYFDPRLRWWEAAPRYVFDEPVLVNKGLEGFIQNISHGGLFMTFPEPLMEMQTLELTWYYDHESYVISGTVVYKTPKGIGVKFTHTQESSDAARKLMNILNKKGLIVKERLPGPEDSFGTWLVKLIRTREGLFPKV